MLFREYSTASGDYSPQHQTVRALGRAFILAERAEGNFQVLSPAIALTHFPLAGPLMLSLRLPMELWCCVQAAVVFLTYREFMATALMDYLNETLH